MKKIFFIFILLITFVFIKESYGKNLILENQFFKTQFLDKYPNENLKQGKIFKGDFFIFSSESGVLAKGIIENINYKLNNFVLNSNGFKTNWQLNKKIILLGKVDNKNNILEIDVKESSRFIKKLQKVFIIGEFKNGKLITSKIFIL